MRIFATPFFVREFMKLSKGKYVSAYGRIAIDLGTEFSRVDTIPAILQSGSVVTYLGYGDEYKPLKLRAGNSTMKTGKSSGYRVILVTIEEEDAIVLASVYPKIGPLGLENPSGEVLIEMMESYLYEDVYEIRIVGDVLRVIMDD